MVKSSKTHGRSPRKRSLTLSRPTTARSRPQTAPGGAPAATPSPANIRVVVRVRPPNSKEHGDNHRVVVKVVDNQLLVFDPEEESQPFFYHGVQQRGRDLLKKANKNMQFLFDRVFGFDSTNELVFDHSTKDLITALMDGYNCSVFVYGATGAGKTHTMLGHNKSPGITFLTMAELFRQKEQLVKERDFELGVTYLEVYNENVQDLLNPGTALHLREDGKYGVVVAGIHVKRIEEPSELFELLERGNRNRTQHPTDANAESSRSHAVFQVYLRMNIRSTGQVRLAKLSMIDLAGSERGAATGCAGARFTEGANINKSLLALGNCINSLADGQRHIPYRDSKLTRLLKDSLGGNCHTVMIANISPSSLSYEDTYNTLKYATRAKKIKTNIKKNVVNCEMHVEQYIKRVEELNKEVERLKTQLKEQTNTKTLCDSCGGGAGDGPATGAPVPDNTKRAKLLELYAERISLQGKIKDVHSSEQLLELKRQMKVEADSRLSGLLVNATDKEKGHKRIGGAVDRLQKQAEGLKQKMVTLKLKQKDLEKEVEDLVKENPELEPFAEMEAIRLAHLETKHKMEHLENVRQVQNKELQKRGELLESVAGVLRPCYMLLRGNGNAPENLVKKYKTLVRQLQGIESVTWHEEITDSGLSTTTLITSATSTTASNSEEDSATDNTSSRPRGKRKHSSEDNSPNSALDGTFVLAPSNGRTVCAEQLLTKVYNTTPSKKFTPSKAARPFNVCADQFLSKVYEPPPAKRMAKIRSASPHASKENRPICRTVGTMGTAQRFPSAGATANRIIIKKKPYDRVPLANKKPINTK